MSEWRNDGDKLIEFLKYLRNSKSRMVGFNNLHFDYPILHTIILTNGKISPDTIYRKCEAIIEAGNEETRSFTHLISPKDYFVDQLDLFKIHHFDNKARSTSLKSLEFNMRASSIQSLPFKVGKFLTREEVTVLKEYNAYDVFQTKKFYHESLDMIRFREELSIKHKRNFMNHNDTKIGKDFFISELEKSNITCYTVQGNKRVPRGTKRPHLYLKDAILPKAIPLRPEFKEAVDFLVSQDIASTKGVFKDLSVTINDFKFVLGVGGVHGSVKFKRISEDVEFEIIDLDVSSYYPNLAIKNKFFPEHLTSRFCEIYEDLYNQRTKYKKNSAENKMLKLALNGSYGDSNNKYSPLYDPLFTMKITLNGQLFLCRLAEQLFQIPDLTLLQINTDGLTVKVRRSDRSKLEQVASWWENLTGLNLEWNYYKRMFIRDVNNYLAEYLNGEIKAKGAYDHELEWHQNHSNLVVPKIAQQVLLYDKPIRDTLRSWKDPLDFMARAKVPRSSKLVYEGYTVTQLPNITRYYVSQEGGYLYKWMPPLEEFKQWRKMAICSGWKVLPCNELTENEIYDFDYEYYAQEIEKLCLPLI